MIDHRVVGGPVDLADDGDGLCPGLDAVELDAVIEMDDEIADVNIPTGAPRRYEFDDRLGVVSAEYLGDPEAVARAAAAVAAQAGTAS